MSSLNKTNPVREGMMRTIGRVLVPLPITQGGKKWIDFRQILVGNQPAQPWQRENRVKSFDGAEEVVPYLMVHLKGKCPWH